MQIGLPTSLLFSESIARKGDYFQGLRVGSCLTPWNELSKEMHCWQSKRLYREGALERSRVREPKKTALPCGSQSRFYGNQVSVWFLSGQLLWLRVIPGGMYSLSQDGFQQEGFWEVGRTCGLESTLSFSLLLFPSPFPNSSSWW